MKVAIGADHGGFELKEYLKKSCQDKGIEIVDLGTYSAESCDYPLIADKVAAEIIRGGLNSIPKGQFEAAYSQGFNFVQTLVYIILPQCFKNIVPTLLSQVITVVKDTSFLSMVAVAELMFRSRNVLSLLPRYTGQTVGIEQVAAIFGFAALIYFVINFSLSCIVRWYQARGKSKAEARTNPSA